MNEFLTLDFDSIWQKHSPLGIRQVVGRMPVEKRPTVECWLRKNGHEQIDNMILLCEKSINSDYKMCWYRR